MVFIRLRGLGVSPGIAIGEVELTEKVVFTSVREPIPRADVQGELERLRKAVERTRKQLVKIREEIEGKIGKEHAFIFESHLLILEDKILQRDLEHIIREQRARAEWALSQIHEKYRKVFESIENDYFAQRRYDVTDVLSKVYKNLEPARPKHREDEKEKILVAHELLPSEAAARLSEGNVLGVALDMGGQTSHTAILARSLDIPAVVGLRNISQRVRNGDILVVDGTDGEVLINPPRAVQKEFESKKQKYDDYRKELRKTAKLSSKTLDGHVFFPMANIELPEEVEMAFSLGAEGIGLFRSEFIYLQRASPPSEEAHFQIYSRIAKDAYPSPVYIRTIDLGGEKNLPQLKIEKEPNPALGLRAIRLSLRDRELFRVQVKAVLRASTQKNIKLLVPMITEMEEIEEVKRLLEDVKNELRSKGEAFDENIPLGVMIEVPAAAAIADIVVKEVDYISIGTNDLIQFYLAVDRAIVLLGLGLQKFSMNPIFIPKIKKVLRSVSYAAIRDIVGEAMTLKTAQEIEEFILEQVLSRHPKAFLMG
ncbi:MAG: phosphoenolpyruvate--protein phosphotransferase [Candidatus Aminicenantales bacterium]